VSRGLNPPDSSREETRELRGTAVDAGLMPSGAVPQKKR